MASFSRFDDEFDAQFLSEDLPNPAKRLNRDNFPLVPTRRRASVGIGLIDAIFRQIPRDQAPPLAGGFAASVMIMFECRVRAVVGMFDRRIDRMGFWESLGWGERAALVAIGAIFALRLALAALVFVTHLVEVRTVCSMVPVDREASEAIDPRLSSSEFNPYTQPMVPTETYAESRNRRAEELGFVSEGVFKQAQGGIYQARFQLWLSPTGDFLAVVVFGKVAKLKLDKTILYSLTEAGRYVVSSDRPTGVNAPMIFDNEIFWQMDLDRLVAGHRKRLSQVGLTVRPIPIGDGFARYREMRLRLAEALAEAGEIDYLEPDQATFRSTIKGAFLATLRSFKTPKIHRT